MPSRGPGKTRGNCSSYYHESSSLTQLQRLCFQLEEAQWYYEDFVRVQNPSFPSMKLRSFSENLFNVCPLLTTYTSDVSAAITHFQSYKNVIPVRGAIILNKKMTKALMVKGWKSNATWGFPRGKINKHEPDDSCAVREVYEEIGFNISPYLKPNDFIEVTIRQKNFKLYVISGVPGNTQFCPQTRKEISKIEWHGVKSLPAFSSDSSGQSGRNYFMVAPFMHGLSKYIAKKRGLPSSLSKSETKALKNLLGVGSDQKLVSAPVVSSEEDKDAAAAELLDLLKFSGNATDNVSGGANLQQISQPIEPSDTQSDRNILLDLLHGKTEDVVQSGTEAHDLESAREILSLLKTNIDRSKEEVMLNEMSHQAPHLPPMPNDPNLLPNMHTGIPPWAYMNPAMNYQMFPPMSQNLPPVPPGATLPQFALSPYNGVPPFPIPGYPMPPFGMLHQDYPIAPSLMMPPQSEPSTPLQHHTHLSSQSVFDHPRSPTQNQQPNSTLLALLNSRSRGKKGHKVTARAPENSHKNTASSGSVALLSLLQKPETPKEHPFVYDTVSSSNSTALLDLLRPPAAHSGPVEPEPTVSQPSVSSNLLMSFLKSPQAQQPATSPAPSDISAKNDLLNLLKSSPSETPPKAPAASGHQNDTSSALLMGLLRSKQGSEDFSNASPQPIMHDTAILNVPTVSSVRSSPSSSSFNTPDESSVLLGMIKSQPPSTSEPQSSTLPIYRAGITLHDLEAKNFRNDSQSPGKDLLQQLDSEEQLANSNSMGNNLLSLLNNPATPGSASTGEGFPGIFDSSPRPNSRSNQQFSQSPSVGGILSHFGNPPIGRPSGQLQSGSGTGTINTPTSTAGLGLQATGNSLLSLLRQSSSPPGPSSRSHSISTESKSLNQSPLIPSSTPPPGAQQQSTEQAHLESLFSKIQVANPSGSNGNVSTGPISPRKQSDATSSVDINSTPTTPGTQDLRSDLLAFLHNFSNGTLPGNANV